MLGQATYQPEFVTEMFGTVIDSPKENLVAGSFATLGFTIKIGKYGIDDGGHLKLAWPITNAFGVPQFENSSAINYTVVRTDGETKLEYDFSHSGFIRPHKPCLTVKIWDGSLKQGDTISIIMGATNSENKGLKIQPYVENKIPFKILLDPFGTNLYTELPDSPFLNVINGEYDHPHIKNQSQIVKGEPFWILIRGNDKWGNTADLSGQFMIKDNMGKIKRIVEIPDGHEGPFRIEEMILKEPGIYQFTLTDMDQNIVVEGNPLEVLEASPDLNLYWGDLHGQTGETVGSGTIDEYLTFGREVAGIDFISHAANAFQITNKIWAKTQRAIKEYHEPHTYVTFLGYEWSGVSSAGGDHNVYYLHDDQPIFRCSHALIEDKSDLDTDRYPVSELYKEFEGRDDVLIIPHIGGRRATLDVFDQNLTPFIEIVSVHGHFQWFADEAMERGLKTGFICSSDTHSGRPGDTFPVTYIEAVPTGLTAVYANSLTRGDLWDAFKQRHVYGTTGARIILDFSCSNHMMGDVIHSNRPTFSASIIGTAAIERAEIVKNGSVYYTYPLLEEKTKREDKIVIRWSGARTQYRRRNSKWSGTIEIENGEILEVEEIAFDLPWEGVKSWNQSSITFVSTTAGDYDGLSIRYKGDQTTSFKFSSEILDYEFAPSTIDDLIFIPAGEVEQRIEIVPLYEEDYPKQIEFNFTDEDFHEKSSYYLRILQVDGEKAWSSPIFVNKS